MPAPISVWADRTVVLQAAPRVARQIARLTVDESGKPTRCDVVPSAPGVDEGTCDDLLSDMLFPPSAGDCPARGHGRTVDLHRRMMCGARCRARTYRTMTSVCMPSIEWNGWPQ